MISTCRKKKNAVKIKPLRCSWRHCTGAGKIFCSGDDRDCPPYPRWVCQPWGPSPCPRCLCQPWGPCCGLRDGPGQEQVHWCDTGDTGDMDGTGDTGDTGAAHPSRGRQPSPPEPPVPIVLSVLRAPITAPVTRQGWALAARGTRGSGEPEHGNIFFSSGAGGCLCLALPRREFGCQLGSFPKAVTEFPLLPVPLPPSHPCSLPTRHKRLL